MRWSDPSLTNLVRPSSDLRWVCTCDVPAVCLTPGFPIASFAPHLPLGRTSLIESNLWSQSLSWPMYGPVTTLPRLNHKVRNQDILTHTHCSWSLKQNPLKSWLWCRGRTHRDVHFIRARNGGQAGSSKSRLCDNLEGWDGVGSRFTREGTYVYLRLIHVDIWQKQTQYCKAIVLQLKINLRNKMKSTLKKPHGASPSHSAGLYCQL